MMINERNRNWHFLPAPPASAVAGFFCPGGEWDDVANPANAISRRLGWMLADCAEVDERNTGPNSMSYDPIPYASEQGI
jgi:hypothetical protein